MHGPAPEKCTASFHSTTSLLPSSYARTRPEPRSVRRSRSVHSGATSARGTPSAALGSSVFTSDVSRPTKQRNPFVHTDTLS